MLSNLCSSTTPSTACGCGDGHENVGQAEIHYALALFCKQNNELTSYIFRCLNLSFCWHVIFIIRNKTNNTTTTKNKKYKNKKSHNNNKNKKHHNINKNTKIFFFTWNAVKRDVESFGRH